MTQTREASPVCLADFVADVAASVNAALPELLPSLPAAAAVSEVMQYAVAGGKRVRPAIVMLAAETFGLDREVVMPTACGIECLHVATLVHDDLPCIDDDDLRRGRPTCHKVFGEATALLAGDALLLRGLELMAEQADSPQIRAEDALQVVREVAALVGAEGVIGGEAADIAAEGASYDEATLEFIHVNKTAKLLVAPARAGAILARAEAAGLAAITEYAERLGLLYQITDDILNVVGDPAATGKAVGSDAAREKATYPALLGLEAARSRATALAEQAQEAAARLPRNRALWAELALSVLHRDR